MEVSKNTNMGVRPEGLNASKSSSSASEAGRAEGTQPKTKIANASTSVMSAFMSDLKANNGGAEFTLVSDRAPSHAMPQNLVTLNATRSETARWQPNTEAVPNQVPQIPQRQAVANQVPQMPLRQAVANQAPPLPQRFEAANQNQAPQMPRRAGDSSQAPQMPRRFPEAG